GARGLVNQTLKMHGFRRRGNRISNIALDLNCASFSMANDGDCGLWYLTRAASDEFSGFAKIKPGAGTVAATGTPTAQERPRFTNHQSLLTSHYAYFSPFAWLSISSWRPKPRFA